MSLIDSCDLASIGTSCPHILDAVDVLDLLAEGKELDDHDLS
jgi:hypothetical protein